MAVVASYGSWASPIDAAETISKLVSFEEVRVDGDDLYWLEMRPAEGGRQALVRRPAGAEAEDLTPPPTNVRSRVHEYGGGAYLVSEGTVVYSDFGDQRLYRLRSGEDPEPITPEPPRPQSLRYADGRRVGEVIVCVREYHPPEGEAVNELVVVPLDGSRDPQVLVSGPNFVSSPRVSPDGARLAWLSWNHPNMPWDGTELWVAPLGGRSVGEAELVAGGRNVSVVQPEWGPDGALYFFADPGGWWNLHRYDVSGTRCVLEMEAEFGFPQWVFGASCYGFLSEGRILAAYYEQGLHRLGVIDGGGRLNPVDLDYSRYDSVITDGQSRVFFVASHPRRPSRIVELDVDRGTEEDVRANPDLVDPAYIPDPQPINFPTGDGDVAHVFYYPPTNPEFKGPHDEPPPLRVKIHGGPTANTYPVFTLDFLFWTSRGFGVADLNYRGSTGYGRAYRDQLKGGWGVVDVEDAVAAARYLAEQGLAQPERLTITGASAGGFTTLAALALHDTFAAGSSYFGVTDLELFEESTHKFESRYLDGLVGSQKAKRERSPISHLDGFDRPVILFQGLEDEVVPPDQARMIADALDRRGVPHALVLYEGEDHGFRNAENIANAIESELSFFGNVLGFQPAGDLASADVRHLEAVRR